MRILCWLLLFISLCNCKGIKNKNTALNKATVDSLWNQSSKTTSTMCDTLILREICDYCNGETSYYYPHKFGPTTSCLCFGFNEFTEVKINEFLKQHSQEIHYISIENPSGIIYKLNFKNLRQLKTLQIFGNDYNSSTLKTFPKTLLKLPQLRTLVFDGVLFPSAEISRITKQYPKLKFIGEISEPN